MAKHRKKPKGSSRAGRPKTEAPRYACGKPKPPPPNEKVILLRAELCGANVDLVNAENAFDLMLARRWITEDQHRAGREYAFLYRKAGVDLPRIKTADLGEASDRNTERAPEKGFRLRPEWMDQGDADTMGQLKDIWSALPEAPRRQLLEVCILGSWPQWVVFRARGKPVPTVWEQKREQLVEGLNLVCAMLDRRQRYGNFRNERLASL